MTKGSYVYFLFSADQIKEKNKILYNTGKVFEPGTVIINGNRKKFTQLSTKPTIPRYIDAEIVAQGIIDNFIYTEPKNTRKGVL